LGYTRQTHHGHQPVHGVNLAYEVALADAANRRVAGHLANRVEPLRHEQRPGACPTGRCCGLAARVAAAHDDDVRIERRWRGCEAP